MDPLLLAALNFGLAILAGGLVAVIAQRLAFRDARALDRARADRAGAERRGELLRALSIEIAHDIEALDRHRTDKELATLQRTAWDEARGLEMSHTTLAALRLAYREADRYTDFVDRQWRLTAAGGVVTDFARSVAGVVDPVPALMAFENAKRELDAEDQAPS